MPSKQYLPDSVLEPGTYLASSGTVVEPDVPEPVYEPEPSVQEAMLVPQIEQRPTVTKAFTLLHNKVSQHLTLEIIDLIAAETAKGTFPHVAAAQFGIMKPTFSKWMARGETILNDLPEEFDPNEPEHSDIWDNIPYQDRLLFILYVIITQAGALARSNQEQIVYDTMPHFWLQHGPPKGEWSTQAKLDVHSTGDSKMDSSKAKALLKAFNA